MTLETTAHALLAILALDEGDRDSAEAHIAAAQRLSRTTARRQRQVVEIAALAVAGHGDRAVGLAVVHAEEFPEDSDLLARVTGAARRR